MPAVLERVVPADPAPVLEAEDSVEADIGVKGTVRRILLLRQYAELLIEAGKEVLQHMVGLRARRPSRAHCKFTVAD